MIKITKTILTKTGRAFQKSVWFVAVKHKYALYFAIGMTLLGVLLSLFGLPLLNAHHGLVTGFSAALKSHNYLFLFLHILIILAIYLGVSLWIDRLAEKKKDIKGIENVKREALKFLKIITAGLVLIALLAHI